MCFTLNYKKNALWPGQYDTTRSFTRSPEQGPADRQQVNGAACLYHHHAPTDLQLQALTWGSQRKWMKEKGLHCKEMSQTKGAGQQTLNTYYRQ